MLRRSVLSESFLRCSRPSAISLNSLRLLLKRQTNNSPIVSSRVHYHISLRLNQSGASAVTSLASTEPQMENPPTSRMARTTTKQSLRRITPQRVPPRTRQSSEKADPVVALTVADSYELPKVIELFHQLGHLQAEMLLPQEAAYCPYPMSNGHKADTFVLTNGSIVTFGMTELDTIKLADELRTAEIRPYAVRESEDMDYIELPDEESGSEKVEESDIIRNINKRSYMDGEMIIIRGQEQLLDKVAFASGLARSTKLAVIEEGLEKYLESVRDITDRLATGRKLPVHDGREVLKKTGELLALRGNLNLYSELTETPDLYWSEPELETIYRAVSKNLDIAPRIAILNKKLDYVSEVVSILKAHLSEEKGVRLEWMIILLIMVEVCFETVHFVARYFEFPSESAAVIEADAKSPPSNKAE
ncbi:uncharacterized protein V2V93DRAFT_364232 [Kockiozyma suomiensis]|uniref:uncharacterized protein n=1 Tax=Kockiozyma suomiensis TaxID=1337062 RepID=UPI003343B998